jgi:ankyrin repeat protein
MDSLPNEILCTILRYLDNLDLNIYRRINHTWKTLIETKILYKPICPSIEECIIDSDYYHFQKYLKIELDDYQQKLITLSYDKILTKYYQKYPINRSKKYDNLNIDTLLLHYAEIGKIKVVNYLLNKGANIGHISESYGFNDTALSLSAEKGHFDVVKLLLERGANFHYDKDYPFRIAAAFGHLNIVKLLLEPWLYMPYWRREGKGCNIHADDDDALRQSIEQGQLEMVKYLLEIGANIHVQNGDCLRIAVYYEHIEIVKLLLEPWLYLSSWEKTKGGINIHVQNDIALRTSVNNDVIKITKLLLEKGANPNIYNLNELMEIEDPDESEKLIISILEKSSNVFILVKIKTLLN